MARTTVKYARVLDAQVAGGVIQVGVSTVNTLIVGNVAAAARYLKLYDKATAATVADTPILTLMIPAGAAFIVNPVPALHFALGLTYRCTTLPADADATAPTAGDVVLNVGFA